MSFILANNIEAGQFFRKKNGHHCYLKISDSSASFFHLDEELVYGVTFNGNMTEVLPNTLVQRVMLEDFVQNFIDMKEWERNMGIKCTNE